MEAQLKSPSNVTLRATLALAAALSAVPAIPSLAGAPAANADISGKTLFLQPGSWLRYSDALISRVYTTTKATLEVKGRGNCTTRLCPVSHNDVELWAIRTRLDDSKPGYGPIVTGRTLRNGDEGTDVKIAQDALNKAGANIKADGKFGSGTEDAVQAYQEKNGLDADGAIGQATRDKLKI